MKKLVLYAAAAATMASMGTMTSQAAVKMYMTGGNCGSGVSTGNGCSLSDILQMAVSANGSNSCFGNKNGTFTSVLPGTLDNPLVPNCSGNGNTSLGSDCFGSWNCPSITDSLGSWGCQNVPGCSNSWDCSTLPDCFGGTNCPDIQNPGNQNPGNQNPGTQNPGDQNQGTQNPDIQNPDIQNPNQPSDQGGTYIQQVISLVNEERAKAGLSPVTEASDVSSAASVRAREITGNFSHTRPNGSYYNTVLDESGVKYRGSGENIAYGQKTAAEVMNGWMNSQGHRANILNANYTKIGVGCYESSNGVKYWVQLFTY